MNEALNNIRECASFIEDEKSNNDERANNKKSSWAP